MEWLPLKSQTSAIWQVDKAITYYRTCRHNVNLLTFFQASSLNCNRAYDRSIRHVIIFIEIMSRSVKNREEPSCLPQLSLSTYRSRSGYFVGYFIRHIDTKEELICEKLHMEVVNEAWRTCVLFHFSLIRCKRQIANSGTCASKKAARPGILNPKAPKVTNIHICGSFCRSVWRGALLARNTGRQGPEERPRSDYGN